MLVETGKKIFYLSPDTGKESGNISTPVETATNLSETKVLLKTWKEVFSNKAKSKSEYK